jgi:hypothetical protein
LDVKLRNVTSVLPQRGARRIVLTSRRGRKFLGTDALEVAGLKVAYMQRCEDLTLKIEASDAASAPDMR